MTDFTRHNCDLCGSEEWTPIPIENHEQIGICQSCGFCFVRDRRSSAEIAADWDWIYKKDYQPDTWPAVRARLYFVREFIGSKIGYPRGHLPSTLLDIGAGTGTFLQILHGAYVNAKGLEPSAAADGKVDITRGSIEDNLDLGKFDLVTINWTLENCGDAIAMLKYARQCCKPDGHVVVATGSRILVPFKKRLSRYLGNLPADLHAYRWTYNTLAAALRKAGLALVYYNAYEDQDWLVWAATPGDAEVLFKSMRRPYDDPAEVAAFFADWQEWFP